MSAGNYGRTFAYMTNKMHLSGVILMPLTAPDNRAKVIEVIFSSNRSFY